MKKLWAVVAFAAGVAGLWWAFPKFAPIEPHGLKVSRAQVREAADVAARELGIPVENSWVVTTWEETPVLEKELRDKPQMRLAAERDPVWGVRIDYFRVTYFRHKLDKRPEYGFVLVAKDGRVISARRLARAEETGARPTAEQIRPIADRFVASKVIPGAPSPVFDSARPVVQNTRVDHVLRYRVKNTFPLDNVALLLNVYFIGDKLSGYVLIEEYADGRLPRFESESGLVATFIRYTLTFVLLFILLAIFLRKYHAGEVGVGTSSFLLIVVVALSLAMTWMMIAEEALNTGFGGISARATAAAVGGFKFLFFDIPLALLVFLAWSVGESYVRERWGDRLASYDAVFRRDWFNATVGESFLIGFLGGPLVAAAALVPAAIAVNSGFAYLAQNPITAGPLGTKGGPWTVIASAAVDATAVAVVGLLFLIGVFHRRRRLLPLGFVLAAVVGAMINPLPTPIQPELQKILFGVGAIAVASAIFYFYDLLAAGTAVYSAIIIASFVPLINAAEGPARTPFVLALTLPLGLNLLMAGAGLVTRRRIEYQQMDLAPHVKRIVERERVKAEIDAANRIQAALLPLEAPVVNGAEIASHYRSATEIGGDYFDFLPLPGGRVGIAFGDVAGHGLTSGIVMAMAKSALLVQVGYDHSPAVVMRVLNETVRKTAPRRMLMTFFFGVLDPVTQELRFSSAGHLDPYVFRAERGVLEPLSSWGFPLGVKRRDDFRELTASFEAGDRLVLYSDGLIEAVDDDGEPFGFERFEKVLRTAGTGDADEIKKAVLNAVKRFTHNRPPEDDQTLVVISFEGTRAESLTA